MDIALAIMAQYPNADPLSDFRMQDDSDGKGPYIAMWNIKDASGNVAPQPTSDELDEWAFTAAQTAQKATLYDAWQSACLTFQSSVLGGVHTYTNDEVAIGRYNAIMARIARDSTYTPPPIYTHEAGYVAHTAAQFTQVFDDGMAAEQTDAQTYEQKVAQVINIALSSYPAVDDAIAAVQAVTW